MGADEPHWEMRLQVESEIRLREAIHAAYVEVAVAGLARSLRRAEGIFAVAGSVGVLYAGILGIVFADDGRDLPLRAVIPALFTALALVFASHYVGSLRGSTRQAQPLISSLAHAVQQKRLSELVDWVNQIMLARVWAIRSSVWMLALGVSTLPLPLLGDNLACLAWIPVVLGIVAVTYEALRAKPSSEA